MNVLTLTFQVCVSRHRTLGYQPSVILRRLAKKVASMLLFIFIFPILSAYLCVWKLTGALWFISWVNEWAGCDCACSVAQLPCSFFRLKHTFEWDTSYRFQRRGVWEVQSTLAHTSPSLLAPLPLVRGKPTSSPSPPSPQEEASSNGLGPGLLV